MNKRIISFILCIVLIFSVGICASAENETQVTDETTTSSESYTDEATTNSESYTAANGYSYDYMIPNLDKSQIKYDDVYDFADLLSDEEEKRLSDIASAQGSNYGITLAFLTYDDSFGRTTRTFTDDFFDYFYGLDCDGILFAVDMDNRQVYINTMGVAINNVTDEEWDSVLDDTYTYASDGDYNGFFINTLDKTLYAFSDDNTAYEPYDYGGEYGVIDSAPNPFLPTVPSLIASIVVAVIAVLGSFGIHSLNNKAPAGNTYMDEGFKIISKQEFFRGTRTQVLHDYYKSDSSGGGGGSSHSSGGGGSHGGGGHGF